MTKERPIIFSAPMVRAILDGRKTQARWIVKPQPEFRQVYTWKGTLVYDCSSRSWCWGGKAHGRYPDEYEPSLATMCPYGRPGDRLWVRETFCIESSKEVAYEPPHDDGRPVRRHQDEAWGPWWEQPHYRATDPPPELEIGTGEPGVRWSPSVHMPRWASRIMLEITDVRVQRLQDIGAEEAEAEGVKVIGCALPVGGDIRIAAFCRLWESINGSGSWDANRWVWAITFKRIETCQTSFPVDSP